MQNSVLARRESRSPPSPSLPLNGSHGVLPVNPCAVEERREGLWGKTLARLGGQAWRPSPPMAQPQAEERLTCCGDTVRQNPRPEFLRVRFGSYSCMTLFHTFLEDERRLQARDSEHTTPIFAINDTVLRWSPQQWL